MNTSLLIAELYTRMALDARSAARRPSEAPNFARRSAIAEKLGSLRTERVEASPVPVVTSHDREAFLAASEGASRPVVLRGFARQTAARWSEQMLRARVGGATVTVMNMKEDAERNGWDVGNEHVKLTVAELLDRIPEERLYLNNSTELFVDHPDLMAELQLDRLSRFTTPDGTWDELLTTNFFIGGRKVRSAIHTAYGGNFFMNLVGRKRWRFIDPRYSPWLHPVPARPFDYATSAHGSLYSDEQDGIDDSIFFRLPREEVLLEPGDVLYSAPWWWHEVDNQSDLNVACAVRHLQPPGGLSPSFTNCVPMAMASRFPKSRFLTTVHYLKHRYGGGESSLRARVNQAVWQRVNSSLDQR